MQNGYINKIFRLSNDILICFSENFYRLISIHKKDYNESVTGNNMNNICYAINVLKDGSDRIFLSCSNNNRNNFWISQFRFEPSKDSICPDIYDSDRKTFNELVTNILDLSSGKLLIVKKNNNLEIWG